MRAKPRRSLRRVAGYAAALLTGAVMGISWPLQKFILGHEVIGPATLHWLNVIGLFVIILPIYLVRFQGRLRWHGFSPSWLLVFGGVACVMHYGRNFGLRETSATTAAVVELSEVVFIFLISYLVLRRPIRPLGWLGTGLVLYGIIRVAMVGATALQFSTIGVFALVVVGLTIAINALLVKTKFMGIPNELIVLGSTAVQLVVFSTAVPAAGLLPEVGRLLQEPYLLMLVILGSVVWGARLMLYYFALKQAPIWAVRMLALTGLPIATLSDLLVLRIPVTWTHVEGLIIAIIGAALVIQTARGRDDLQAAAQETG